MAGLTMLLLSRQDGSLGRHRDGREVGVASVVAHGHSWAQRLVGLLDWGLGVHGGGFSSTVELDGRRGLQVGGHDVN